MKKHSTRKIRFAFLIFIFSIYANLQAQETAPEIHHSGWHFAARGGFDFPTFNNSTPFIHYDGGLELGASVDYYWNWIGVGADFDHINNKPHSTYPTQSLIYNNNPVTSLDLTEDKITRIFYGIGPSFKYQKNNKFSAELKLRAGLASIKGGRTNLDGATSAPLDLDFHAGYDRKNVFSAKGALQFNYFVTESFGFHVGGYYLEHFKVKESTDASGISSGFRDYYTTNPPNTQPVNNIFPQENLRKEPCNCEVHSVGVYAGITYRIVKKKPQPKKVPVKIYSLTVIAKDKFTQELLPNTEVTVKNAKGEIVQKGTTNEAAEVVFDSITPENYSIEGILFHKNLEGATTLKKEFLPGQSLKKVILYSDSQFILKGVVKDVQTKLPLGLVSVLPKGQENIVTGDDGKFMVYLDPKGDNPLYLKKDNYFSKTEKVPTDKLNRKRSLFVDVDLEMEKFDCGKAIKLENIHYDLDKFFIREDAKPELDKLVRFMTDNPEIKVELSSHTDSRASHKYNAKLSQNRANAAVDYIISQGVDKNRITGKGYGETKLLNKCADKVYCSEADHQLNRRTEMKVICPQQ